MAGRKHQQTHLEPEMDPQTAAEPTGAATEDHSDGIEVHIPEECQKQLEQIRAQATDYLDGWQRSQAEFSNYKKRVEREQSQAHQTAAGSILKRYLGIIDDLDRALKNKPMEGEGAQWAEGIDLIYRKMLALLESEGVKTMQVEGEQFDPNLHEAILTEDSDLYESGQITEVLQQGYLLGDKVLRPAMVRVAR